MTIQRQSNLNFDRWADLRAAVDTLIRTGVYQRLVNIHAAMVIEPDGFRHTLYSMHGSMSGPLGYRRFLPWHRAYLINFERELREIDDSLSIPYWDWDRDQGRLIGFSDRFGLPPRIPRTPPSERGRFFRAEVNIERLLSPDNYYEFTVGLENGPHNIGHGWIGGDMARMHSPSDTAFWFHHAQVDRVWALWQQAHPNERADLSGRDARLDPWEAEFTVRSVNNISNLGDDSYEYIPLIGT